MNKRKMSLLSACCLLTGVLVAPYAGAEDVSDEPQPTEYIIPKDVSCKKSGGLTYCVDKSGKPITGVMLKYKNSTIVRRYSMKDGYLDGIGEAYDDNGYLTQKYPYKKGRLNGVMEFYDRHGKLPKEVPYVDGKKEGIAKSVNEKTTMKAVYINDKMNGKWLIGDNDTKSTIYDLQMENDNVISGIYYHLDAANDKRCCAPDDENECTRNPNAPCCAEVDLIKENLDPVIVEGLKKKCLQINYQEALSCRDIPTTESKAEAGCSEWLEQNGDYRSYQQKAKEKADDLQNSLVKQKRHLL